MKPDQKIIEVMARALVKEIGYGDQVCEFQDAQNATKAAIEALRAAGYAIVPLKPTDKMLNAHDAEGDILGLERNARKSWKRMVRASQEE